MPTRPSARDVARTARVAVTDVLPMILTMARGTALSTLTEDGLRIVRGRFRATLGRLGVALEVLGAERVPAEGGLVFMWNQETHLDHLVLAAAIPRPFFTLYNNEVARVPGYGRQLRNTGHVHLDRNDEGQWRPAIARAAERVLAGECVLISPEGTRSADGRLLPMKRGALMLAEAAARPVVCITVVGGHDRMPRGSPFVRGGPLRIVFSEPLAVPPEAESIADAIIRTFERTKREHAL
jgi:1-acyl-sn-glycerol-3-phosphate acyltransferase